MFPVRCEDDDAVLCSNSAQPKRSRRQGNADIDVDTNTSKQYVPTVVHGVFVGYHVFSVRCEDDDAVLYCNSA